MKNVGKILVMALAVLASTPVWAKDASGSPIVKGGNFGIGLVLGAPGDWGVSGKAWLTKSSAIQAALNLDDGTVLQADYLWHYYGLVHPSRGLWPVYIGVGGAIALEGDGAIAPRMPVGMDYIFEQVPVDIFVEVAPYLWFFDGGSDFKIKGALGARYFF